MFSKGGISLLLEMLISIAIVVFLFWFFYLKAPSTNVPNNIENYQELIESAKLSKCLAEATNQQAKDNCLLQYPQK